MLRHIGKGLAVHVFVHVSPMLKGDYIVDSGYAEGSVVVLCTPCESSWSRSVIVSVAELFSLVIHVTHQCFVDIQRWSRLKM